MKPLDNDSFAEKVLAMASDTAPFVPTADYDPDGDCIEFLTTNADFYAERVDDLVTVYYDRQTREIMGSLIKGVRDFVQKVLETNPGFAIEIHDGRVRLAHLFRARLWSKPPKEIPCVQYLKLLESAEAYDIETEFSLA